MNKSIKKPQTNIEQNILVEVFMFIKGIIVPILIVCLVLFVGVSANNSTNDNLVERPNNETENIATTPSIITNREDLNSNMVDEKNDMQNEKSDAMEYEPTLIETRIVNEVERINGIDTARIRTNGSNVYIAALKEEGNQVSETVLKQEIRNIIRNVDSSYEKIFISFLENEYNNLYSGNTNNNFSSFETRSEVITVY